MAFAKRYTTSFTDNDNAKPCDAQALNAIESALLKLFDTDPSATGQSPVWNGTKYAPKLHTNAEIDPAAAIAYSKLNLTGAIVNADLASSLGLSISKLAGYPSDGSKVLKGDGTWGSVAGGGFGTTLPSTPSDGDEYFYIADATKGVVWHLKYKTSLTKWCFVGGSALLVEVAAGETRSANTYGDLTTSGPSITLPLAGDYEIEHGFSITNLSGTFTSPAKMSYSIGASAASDIDLCQGISRGTFSRKQPKTGLGAVALVSKYVSDGSVTVTFEDRWISAKPIKVGP